MIHVSQFARAYAPLCVYLGVPVLGYLGYQSVRWIRNKCHKTEIIDRVAQQAIASISSEKGSESSQAITNGKIPEEKKVDKAALREAFKLQEPCTLELRFPEGPSKTLEIQEFTAVEMLVEELVKRLNLDHIAIELYSDDFYLEEEMAAKLEIFQKLAMEEPIQFSVSEWRNWTIVAEPKIIKSEKLDEGKIRKTYSNDTIEEIFFSDEYRWEGTREFSNGKKEKGKFSRESLKLVSGYRREADGTIEFTHPKSFASYTEELKTEVFQICEVEGKLVVLERNWHQYRVTEIPVETILLKVSQRPFFGGDGESIKDVLLHTSFKERQGDFFKSLMDLDEKGTPRLFTFSNLAALDVMEVTSQEESLNPLKIVDSVSGRNFFVQVAYWGDQKLLERMIELFPKEASSIGKNLIATLLTEAHSHYLVRDIVKKLENLRSWYHPRVLDNYHHLWVQVAEGNRPDEAFKEQFDLLSVDQQRVLYDAGVTYANPFIHEPSDFPVTGNQYSLNFMWMGENKLPWGDDFWDTEEKIAEEWAISFEEVVTNPVSKWALKNPESPIHIWIDSEGVTPQALETAKISFEKASCAVQWRDVRCLEVVRANPSVFSEKFPLLFRRDLLKAIVADYVLSSKETKFFVSPNLDFTGEEPLSTQEIFDKRTTTFLNEFGFVLAKDDRFEEVNNKFQIFNRDNPLCIELHRRVVVDLNITRALKAPENITESTVSKTYPTMFYHYEKGCIEKDEEEISGIYIPPVSSYWKLGKRMPKKPLA